MENRKNRTWKIRDLMEKNKTGKQKRITRRWNAE